MAAPRSGKRRRTHEDHDDIAEEAAIAEELAAAGLVSVVPGKEVKNTVRGLYEVNKPSCAAGTQSNFRAGWLEICAQRVSTAASMDGATRCNCRV